MISIGFGPTYLANKSKIKLHPEVLGKGAGGNDDWFYQISYTQSINKNILISGSYSIYPVSTLFNFQSENGGGGYGWVGTDIKRIDIGCGWNIFNKTKHLIQPDIHIAAKVSKEQWAGFIGDIPTDIIHSGFEQLSPIIALSYNIIQIVPVLGLKLGYAFWNRIEIFFDIRMVHGYKAVQKLTLQYYYKGVRPPDAVSYSDGTGRFYELGLGYRFVKPKAK